MRTWTFNLLRYRPILAGLVLAGTGIGCNQAPIKPDPIPARYSAIPPREVPEYLRGTILQIADLAETQPKLMSGFGLVVNLEGTGDSAAPNPVREYMLKEMTKRGFGSSNLPGYERLSPDRVLRDPRTTIVRVDGFIPPGARKGDRIDVQVSALPNNNTSSLARGILYLCDVKVGGANPMLPGDTSINPDGAAGGPIFVNPAYALSGAELEDPNAKLSLRRGIVLGGAILRTDRPLMLRVRTPSWGTAREIERRIDLHFQDSNAAQARDDGVVTVRVPARYGDDWEHFAGVVMHLFMNSSSEFAAMKARGLVEEAIKPDAPLSNITYALEALGPPAIPFIVTLLNHTDPDVQFAAARAAAWLGDQSATVALQRIAESPNHPFQLNAVRVLGRLQPRSPMIAAILRELVSQDDSLVRIAAYEGLLASRDGSILSIPMPAGFTLDMVRSNGAPLIYATRSGRPRIALFGEDANIITPMTMVTLNNRLTLTSPSESDRFTVFYRQPGRDPVEIQCPTSLTQFIRLLGADVKLGEPLNFGYGDVVALLQRMSDRKMFGVPNQTGMYAEFVLQEPSIMQDTIDAAPPIEENPMGPSRPQGNEDPDAALPPLPE